MRTIFGSIGQDLASISYGYHWRANIDYGFNGIETSGDQQSNLTSNRTKCARNESTIIQTLAALERHSSSKLIKVQFWK